MADKAKKQTCPNMPVFSIYFVIAVICMLSVDCKSGKTDDANEKWKKKDVTDYSDADVERLYEQWEDADDEPLPDDELPEWKRPQPKIDMSKLDPNDPEGMLKMSKKGKTLMLFATVAGNPDEKETEKISTLWQTSLHNANVDVQRYVVGSNRVLFVVRDGALAWDVKKFLVAQDNCELVTIEGKDYRREQKDSKAASAGKRDKKKINTKASGENLTKKPKKKAKKMTEEEKLIKKNIENEIDNNNQNRKTEL